MSYSMKSGATHSEQCFLGRITQIESIPGLVLRSSPLPMPRRSELDLPLPAGMSPHHPTFDDDPPDFDEDHVLAERYRVHVPICRGGMGEVYRIVDLRTQEHLALKMLMRRRAHRPHDILRFEREINALRAVAGHPGVVELRDDGILSDGRRFFVMELIASTPANVEQRRSIASRCEAAMHVASALGHIHRRGVVHRDIKPSNILWADAGPKIIDFGVAVHGDEATFLRVTDPGQGVGTLEYLAPEQHRFAAPDPAADFYALAITLFEWLTGAVPFRGDDEQQMQAKARGVPPFSLAFDRLPRPLQSFILACLAPDPRVRIADEARFIAGLRAALGQIDTQDPVLEDTTATAPPAPTPQPLAAATERSIALPPTPARAVAPQLGAASEDPAPANLSGPSPSPQEPRSTPRRSFVLLGTAALLGLFALFPWMRTSEESPLVRAAAPPIPDTAAHSVIADAPAPAASKPAVPSLPLPPPSIDPEAVDHDSSRSAPSPSAEPEEPSPGRHEVSPPPTDATTSPPTPSRASSPRRNAHRTSLHCEQQRSKAAAAITAFEATTAMALVEAEPTCWTRNHLVRLRTTVHFLRKNWQACVREGRKTADPQVKKLVHDCEQML